MPWLAALAIVTVVGVMQHLDSIDDHHSEHARAIVLEDAQRDAARELRRDLAAAALCREQHGESGIAWTEAGALVCIPRKGKRTQHAATAAGLEVQP
ncbi:MAG: hypothetical protein K9K35_10460 [Rhodoferax sp.]|nr:hypothetical protein [Rhodoferax sp.]